MVTTEKMDRSTDACKAHLSGASMLDIRQTRKGWFQECLGCEAKTELKYFAKDTTQIAESKEETDCFCRMCCTAIHPFTMRVNEIGTEAELLTVERPLRCGVGGCKCCCYQTAKISSGGAEIATIEETCYYCIPTFSVTDAQTGEAMYKLHPPSCCGGLCINCCAEGNPCGKGCCKVSFLVFGANQKKTDGPEVEYLGKILKKPKSLAVELFTDANAFEVTFPKDATVDEKATLVGTAVFLNAAFFEADDS